MLNLINGAPTQNQVLVLLSNGVRVQKLKKLGFGVVALQHLGFTPRMLVYLGFTKKDFVVHGSNFTVSDYKREKANLERGFKKRNKFSKELGLN